MLVKSRLLYQLSYAISNEEWYRDLPFGFLRFFWKYSRTFLKSENRLFRLLVIDLLGCDKEGPKTSVFEFAQPAFVSDCVSRPVSIEPEDVSEGD